MVEPDRGEPAMPAMLADLNALGVPLMAIVEHDLYRRPGRAAADRHPHPRLTHRRPASADRARTPPRSPPAWCAVRADLLA